MPLPPSVVRFNRNGVTFESNVNRAEYTLQELTRAALRDMGKFINYIARKEIRKIAGKSLRRSKRPRNAYQHWVRKRETDLIVGIKHNTWYGVDQELGLNGQKKRDILRQTVLNNIDMLEQIQAKYLQYIEDEREARRVMQENEEVGDDGDTQDT